MISNSKSRGEEESEEDLLLLDASGFSMWPFIKDGDKLLVKKVCVEDLKIGDAIVYRNEDELAVCHRLIKITKESRKLLLYARGDNSCFSPLELVSVDRFIGKIAGIFRNGSIIHAGGVMAWLVTRVIIIAAPLVRIIVKVSGGCKRFNNHF